MSGLLDSVRGNVRYKCGTLSTPMLVAAVGVRGRGRVMSSSAIVHIFIKSSPVRVKIVYQPGASC